MEDNFGNSFKNKFKRQLKLLLLKFNLGILNITKKFRFLYI